MFSFYLHRKPPSFPYTPSTSATPIYHYLLRFFLSASCFTPLWQKVVFEKMPSYCLNCMHIGHSKESCILLNGRKPVKAATITAAVPVSAPTQPTADNTIINNGPRQDNNLNKWVEVHRKSRNAGDAGPSNPSIVADVKDNQVFVNTQNKNKFNVLQEDQDESNTDFNPTQPVIVLDLNTAVLGISAATNPLFVENMTSVSSSST